MVLVPGIMMERHAVSFGCVFVFLAKMCRLYWWNSDKWFPFRVVLWLVGMSLATVALLIVIVPFMVRKFSV